MNTFHKYLLSYIGTLLVPIMILVSVFSFIVNHHVVDMLDQQLDASLEQFGLSIGLQTTQLDAYAVQTTERSAFYGRNRTDYAAIFDIRRTITQWAMADSFMSEVYYYNTGTDTVYSFDAVYSSLEDFVYWRLSRYGVTEESLRETMNAESGRAWRAANGMLAYFTSARISQKERGWLVGVVDLPVLRQMVNSALPDAGGHFFIYSTNGAPLFSTSETTPNIETLPTGAGTYTLNGVEMRLSRRTFPNGLICVSMVPISIFNRPLREIWMWMYVGLAVLLALGGVVIMLVMRMNFAPIRRLEEEALYGGAQVERSQDAVQNVRIAIENLRKDHIEIEHNTRALAKERLILKLLTGCYPDQAAFNRDGASIRLSLQGDCWHIVVIREQGEPANGENAVDPIVEVARGVLNGPILYLEIPENRSLIFVVVGGAADDEAKRLNIALEENALYAEVTVGERCDSVAALSTAWQKLSFASNDRAAAREREQELMESLANALSYDETERVRFVFQALEGELPELAQYCDLRKLALDVLALVGGKLTQGELNALRTRANAFASDDAQSCGELLTHVAKELEREYEAKGESQQRSLISEIEAYLIDNYRDPSFTVRQTAERFNVSISNLAHYFKNHVGASVSEYVEKLRIGEAQALLRETDRSVAEIGAMVGYATPATFMRAFKKVTGMSPTGWRNEQI